MLKIEFGDMFDELDDSIDDIMGEYQVAESNMNSWLKRMKQGGQVSGINKIIQVSGKADGSMLPQLYSPIYAMYSAAVKVCYHVEEDPTPFSMVYIAAVERMNREMAEHEPSARRQKKKERLIAGGEQIKDEDGFESSGTKFLGEPEQWGMSSHKYIEETYNSFYAGGLDRSRLLSIADPTIGSIVINVDNDANTSPETGRPYHDIILYGGIVGVEEARQILSIQNTSAQDLAAQGYSEEEIYAEGLDNGVDSMFGAKFYDTGKASQLMVNIFNGEWQKELGQGTGYNYFKNISEGKRSFDLYNIAKRSIDRPPPKKPKTRRPLSD